ncbi:MAG: isochorismatase family protein [Pirellulales bacterium]|nr:isochorismatase family protein [Pirellulales bacterium]
MTAVLPVRRLLTSLVFVAIYWVWAPVGAQTFAEPAAAAGSAERSLHLKPRYYRWFVEPGKPWIEKNTSYGYLDWEVPLSQVGLVLVDVWDRHYLEDPKARAEKIIQEKIRPLLDACRRAGVEIIHAPSPPQAKECPTWVGRTRAEPPAPAACATVDRGQPWPPAEFRGKTGPYARYARPVEPQANYVNECRAGLTMHPDVRPVGSEVVVATGDELHEHCRKKGILFLVFLGFNTNACVLLRDYGTLEMGKRGYEVIVVRDCTTGMESFETTDELWQTRGAILFLEMFGKYSVASEELIAGLPKPAEQP